MGNDTFRVEGTSSAYDVFNGGDGDDTVLGGDGDDTIRVHKFSGGNTVEEINGGGGYNILAGTGANNTIDLSGTTLVGIAHIDAGAGNDTVIGTGSDDTIIGGAGTDALHGGEGDDTYRFSSGHGNDKVHETGGVADRMEFGQELDPVDILFEQTGNDLLVRLSGSSDSVAVKDWYSNPNPETDPYPHQIETFQAGDGSTLVSNQVDLLIQAMAAFTAEKGTSSWEESVAEYTQESMALVNSHWQSSGSA